jgi:formate--tetrahydrofolate ligase
MVGSDIEIARAATMQPITEIGAQLGLPAQAIQPYGHTKAKISLEHIASLDDRPDGKLILVTAMTPTPAGEGLGRALG